MQTVRCRHQPHTRLGLIFSHLHHSLVLSHLVLIRLLSLLCGGNLSSMEAEGVLSSGIIERLCTRIESESSELDVLPTLLVLDRMCSGLNEVIETQKSKPTDQDTSNEADLFSLTRRCEFALARIEAAVLVVKKKVGGQRNPDKKTKEVQKEVGGMLVRHFQSSIHSSKKEIGEIGIDLVAVRREMEAEREILKKAEQERQREFTMKMREMEEMKKMNEELIEEGRQRREEKKREAASKRKEEEEQRRNVKEGAATIEVFARDKFTISGNVFTKSVSAISSLFSHSFGPVVVRITIVFKQLAIGGPVAVGLIAADMVEQATQHQGFFSNLTRAASWSPSPNFRSARQNEKYFHEGSACKAVAVGQRVVMEADGREGKRTLKLSQDGETQPAFFSNIPVPFRFGIYTNGLSASVEIVSSEVLREPSMVGGRLEVVMD
ncbi:hypothetical protein BLNAU_16061 [Blattamonas nauphoetae]|uniref:Uncharacterized protein n=1 Tax=Blattamonas nauphoetae TaxID=2049346 RepID=A0ABQ9XFH9_9EUKA|nr:hypothetical protein BLNAU_16061 [Blattamonas nauphoetae]